MAMLPITKKEKSNQYEHRPSPWGNSRGNAFGNFARRLIGKTPFMGGNGDFRPQVGRPNMPGYPGPTIGQNRRLDNLKDRIGDLKERYGDLRDRFGVPPRPMKPGFGWGNQPDNMVDPGFSTMPKIPKNPGFKNGIQPIPKSIPGPQLAGPDPIENPDGTWKKGSLTMRTGPTGNREYMNPATGQWEEDKAYPIPEANTWNNQPWSDKKQSQLAKPITGAPWGGPDNITKEMVGSIGGPPSTGGPAPIQNPNISGSPGMPNTGMPNIGMPNTGMPNIGMPNPGMPNPGMPTPPPSGGVGPIAGNVIAQPPVSGMKPSQANFIMRNARSGEVDPALLAEMQQTFANRPGKLRKLDRRFGGV